MDYVINQPVCYACHALIQDAVRTCSNCHKFYHQNLQCQDFHTHMCLYDRRIKKFNLKREFLFH